MERNTPLSPASVFDIGSMGKQFTAMLIAILANLSSIEPWRLTEQVAGLYLADLFAKEEQSDGQKAAAPIEPNPEQRESLKEDIPPVPPAQFRDYVGVYYSEELNASHEILLDGEQLCFRRGYTLPEGLQAVTQDVFQANELHFQFGRNEQNRVCAFQLSAGLVKAIRFKICSG